MNRTEEFEDAVCRWLIMIICLISSNFLYLSGFLEGLYLEKLLIFGIEGINVLVLLVIGFYAILGLLEKFGLYVPNNTDE